MSLLRKPITAQLADTTAQIEALQGRLADAALAGEPLEDLEQRVAAAERRRATLEHAQAVEQEQAARKLEEDRAKARASQIETANRRHRAVVAAARKYSEALEAAAAAWREWKVATGHFTAALPPDGKTPDALLTALAGDTQMRQAAEDEAFRVGGVLAGAGDPEARLPGVVMRSLDTPSAQTPLPKRVEAAGKALIAQLRGRQP